MNPNWAVRTPIMHTMALLIAATTQPCQSFRPSRIVPSMVRTQET